MAGSSFLKDPAATLDYQWDWATWLDGDTITSATVTVPAGLTKASETVAASSVTAWLSGGTAGQNYTVTCQISTAGGRTDERSLRIQVRDR